MTTEPEIDVIDVDSHIQSKALDQPMPRAIQSLMSQRATLSVSVLMESDPENVEAVLARRQRNLEMFEKVAIASTRPQDWLFKLPPNGRWPDDATASMDSAAAEQMCDLLEISVIPTGSMAMRNEDDKSVSTYIEGWAYRATTGRLAFVFAERNDKEQFIGRGKFAPNAATRAIDLRSSTMQLLYRKAVETLTGIKKLRPEDLKKHSIDPVLCIFGYGFDDRLRKEITGQGQVARAGKEKAADNGELVKSVKSLAEQMVRVAGNDAGAKLLLSKLTGGMLTGFETIANLKQVDRVTALLLESQEYAKWKVDHETKSTDEKAAEKKEETKPQQQELV